MSNAKVFWYGNFKGIAWRTHDGNPIAVPVFADLAKATKVSEIIKTWNPKSSHLTFIEKDDGTYSICIFEEPDDSGENIGLYRSGMSQSGTYGKVKQMIEKRSTMWNPLKVYAQIVHAKDPADSSTYQNMTDLLPIRIFEIISESQLDSKKFAVEKSAHS
ncbi:MAG TPA: hypothetical protein VLA08_04250 [Nitrosopumilus sp.]|nr:hypothetical protein [Nitrosopumilus sp.]